jgi:hypothetical protein
MRIGITGHSNLALDSVSLVADAIRDALSEVERPFTGATCLARGADQRECSGHRDLPDGARRD